MWKALQWHIGQRSAARCRLGTSGVRHGRSRALRRRPLHLCQGEALLLQPRIQARQLHITHSNHLCMSSGHYRVTSQAIRPVQYVQVPQPLSTIREHADSGLGAQKVLQAKRLT